MSNALQHKLLNIEATPPASTWEKIAEALDESHLSDQFPAQLRAAEVTPPATTWQQVEAGLQPAYAATLSGMEATPPAGVWDKIEASLDEDTKVVPMRRRISPFVKYAAAAMLVGVMAFGGYKLFDSGSAPAEKNTALEEILSPNSNQNNTASANTNGDSSTEETLPTQEQSDEMALEQSKHIYASVDVAQKRRMLSIDQDWVSTPVSPINTANGIAPENTYKDLECSDVHKPSFAGINAALDMSSRYTLLRSPDGHFVRVSKKLGDMVCCVSGEDQDEDCKNQLDKWQKKLANSPVAPSPGNFMDIVDLLHTLKDKSL